MKPIHGVSLSLISPKPKAPYTGMLPGYIAGHFERSELDIDLVRLCRAANCRFIEGAVSAISGTTHTITIDDRRQLHFDIASIDIGVTSNLPTISGFQEFGHPVKPLDLFAEDWDDFAQLMKSKSKAADIVVIGGGIAGLEIAFSVHHHLVSKLRVGANITIVERSNTLLPEKNEQVRSFLSKNLLEKNIRTALGTDVSSVTADSVNLTTGESIASDFTIGAAGAHPHGWLRETDLKLENGYIEIDENLRSLSHHSIFATGDCAHFTPHPLPKAGVYAVRQSEYLYHNIRAELLHKKPKPYRPQKRFLKLISTGSKSAIAENFGLAFGGPLMWRLKLIIDKRFMRQFDDIVEMQNNVPRGDFAIGTKTLLRHASTLCGGCGAKVSNRALENVLCSLPPVTHPNILTSGGDDAAVLKLGDQYQAISTDHLRAFTLDPWLHSKTAAHHALSDLWAMGVKPHSALAVITLPMSSPEIERTRLNEIMTAAADVFTDANCDIVGGHTSVGAEVSIGFTVIGFSDQPPITQANARESDVLILTKPIGVGVVLAAEMKQLADGDWVSSVQKQITTSSKEASEILAPFANSMTDVTGFGLAGHLWSMMKQSSKSAELNLNEIPLVEGAQALATRGVKSTLWQSNRDAIGDNIHLPDDVRCELLFDPQTSGGLLAAIPESHAQDVLKRLNATGENAAIVGRVTPGPTTITVS